MLKRVRGKGYVLLEALIGLMIVMVIVSLIGMLTSQLAVQKERKGCLLKNLSEQLMVLQGNAGTPSKQKELTSETIKKLKKIELQNPSPQESVPIVTVSCEGKSEVFQIESIQEKSVRISPH